MQDFIEKAEGKTVGILNRKNVFDKGSKVESQNKEKNPVINHD